MTIKVGAENSFDTYYSTYTEGNSIPGKGRNLFVNLNYVLFEKQFWIISPGSIHLDLAGMISTTAKESMVNNNSSQNNVK